MVKWLMNKKNVILLFTFSILICGVASLSLPREILAQVLPSLGKDGAGLGLTDALKNKTSQVKSTSKDLISQANEAIKNNTLNMITGVNDALKTSPLSLISQANDALKNSPLNIIDQANEALKNKTSQVKSTSKDLINQAAVKKLESIYSLTNTVGMSMVNGIKVNEIAIGENNVTATLNFQPTQNDTGENSLPVTLIVTKLPVENLTKLLSLASETSKTASTLSSGSGSMDSLINKTKLTPATLNIALQSLDLIKKLQTGVASATLSSSDNSQKITVQTPGGLVSSSTAPNEFVTVLVVPSLGSGLIQSQLPSIFTR